MIPPKIHYCWFGKKRLSDLNRRCIGSWRRAMPGYQIKEWNESNSPLDSAYARAAYDKGLWSKLSNLVRLHALYTEGGIYFDTDVEVIKSFAPFLRHKSFVGFQQEEEQLDWANNAILGAEPENDFVGRCMEMTLELFAATGEFYRSPTVTTMVLNEMGLREHGLQELGGVTIYPAEYFYPFPWFGQFSPDCITEHTHCIHHWEGTWCRPEPHGARLPLVAMKRLARTLILKLH
jgi:hypothetical protein